MIVIENYLAPDQLRTIRDERYWQEPWAGRYVIQENWNIATDTYMFHHFAQEMFLVGAKKHPMLKKAVDIADGIEWWTHKFPNMYANGEHRKSLDWHFDKDEHLWKDHGVLQKPLAVAVLYVHEEQDIETMGKLEIKFGKHQEHIQEIEPKANRCVIFDGSLEHRVTEGTNQITRRSLFANLWATRLHTNAVNSGLV